MNVELTDQALVSTKPQNWAKWLTELRTTDKPQTIGTLLDDVLVEDSVVTGYCCLGLGSCLIPNFDLPGQRGARMDFNDLAPPEFIKWLGLWGDADKDEEPDTGYDLVFDFEWEHLRYDYSPDCSYPSASWANDAGFTFAQIADLLDYFGVRRVLTS